MKAPGVQVQPPPTRGHGRAMKGLTLAEAVAEIKRRLAARTLPALHIRAKWMGRTSLAAHIRIALYDAPCGPTTNPTQIAVLCLKYSRARGLLAELAQAASSYNVPVTRDGSYFEKPAPVPAGR